MKKEKLFKIFPGRWWVQKIRKKKVALKSFCCIVMVFFFQNFLKVKTQLKTLHSLKIHYQIINLRNWDILSLIVLETNKLVLIDFNKV